LEIVRKYSNFSEEPAVLFRGDFSDNRVVIHCRREILLERVQQGIQTLSEGKLHKENTRRGAGERLPKGWNLRFFLNGEMLFE